MPPSTVFFSPVARALASSTQSVSASSLLGMPYGRRPMAFWYWRFMFSTRMASFSSSDLSASEAPAPENSAFTSSEASSVTLASMERVPSWTPMSISS